MNEILKDKNINITITSENFSSDARRALAEFHPDSNKLPHRDVFQQISNLKSVYENKLKNEETKDEDKKTNKKLMIENAK